MISQNKENINGYEYIQGEKLDARSDIKGIKDDKFRSFQIIRDKVGQYIKAHIQIPKHGIVIDLGTGSNAKVPFDIRDIVEKMNGMVIGLDITETGSKAALKKRNESSYHSLKIVRTDSVLLPFKDNCADVITTNLSIHNVFPEPIYDKSGNIIVKDSFSNIFSEAFRVLKYAGYMLVSECVDPTTDVNENMLFRGLHKTIHNLDPATREKYEQAFGYDTVANLFKLAELEWGKDITKEPPLSEYLISPTRWKEIAESKGLKTVRYIRVSPALAHFSFLKI